MGEPKQGQKQIWLPLIMSLAMIGGMVIGLNLKDSDSIFRRIEIKEQQVMSSIELPLLQVVRYIDAKYVDSIDENKVANTAIENLIHELDPHSVYLPKTDYLKSKEQLSGSFVGIGIDFMLIDDTVTVGTVIKNGPAFNAGLHTGDKILKIKDLSIANMKMKADTIIQLIKGERGKALELTCLKEKNGSTYEAKILRDNVSLPSIPAAFIIQDQVGYVNITSFTETTSREFAQAVKDLIDNQGMKDLIIDLRNNPGGYLKEAVEVLNHIFLEKHKLLLYTSGSKVGKKDYHSNGSSRLNINKIAVLINEESASAAEITAGALQDWDRAVIIGRRSFGKGLVQEDLMLANGGAIRMTVARYYTPSGRCIQKDYSNRSDYAHDLRERYENGELFKSEEKIADTTIYRTANGRIVHGGGGISPEIYIPLDSMFVNPKWHALQSYLYEFLLTKPPSIGKRSDTEFLRNFQVSNGLAEEFVAFANMRDKELKFTQFQTYKQEIKKGLKAYIGKFNFNEAMRYKVNALDQDPFVEAALKQLRKEQILAKD